MLLSILVLSAIDFTLIMIVFWLVLLGGSINLLNNLPSILILSSVNLLSWLILLTKILGLSEQILG